MFIESYGEKPVFLPAPKLTETRAVVRGALTFLVQANSGITECQQQLIISWG